MRTLLMWFAFLAAGTDLPALPFSAADSSTAAVVATGHSP